MKKLLFVIPMFAFLLSTAQDKSIVEWLNSNAIPIEDATPTTPPNAFAANVPQKFKDAGVFFNGNFIFCSYRFFVWVVKY